MKSYRLKRTRLIILAVLSIFVFTGCNEIYTTEDSYMPPVIEREEYPVTVEGISFDAPPERILSLSPTMSEMLYELDAWDKVCAAVLSENSFFSSQLAGKELGATAVNPDVDLIVSKTPDLVVTTTPMATVDVKAITDSGAKYLYVPLPKTETEMVELYSMLSLICYGKETAMDRVDAVLAPYFELKDEIYQNIEYISYLAIQSEELFMATGDTFVSEMLSVFGTNVIGDREGYLASLSEIEELLPDVIAVFGSFSEDYELPEEISQSGAVVVNVTLDEKVATVGTYKGIMESVYDTVKLNSSQTAE